jgi:hypothetical protein
MTVGQLKEKLIKISDDTPIVVGGCYGSEGDLIDAYIDKDGVYSIFVLESNVCSG